MILIVSSDNDASTTEVSYWLRHGNAPFLRINERDVCRLQSLSFSDKKESFELTVRKPDGTNVFIDWEDIDAYWYRRGRLDLAYDELDTPHLLLNEVVNEKNRKEAATAQDYIHARLQSKKHINAYRDNFLNKLQVLKAAQELGLGIPATLVTTSKPALERFHERYPELITKSIDNWLSLQTQDGAYEFRTMRFDYEQLKDRLAETFPLSLFQEHIPKRYEIRAFYLHGRFYSSCIFSQADEQTKVDFRNYNEERPNRVVPYRLDATTETKLRALYQRFGLNSGSVDLICGQDGQLYFLEINPIGQFSQVSLPCNYYLEKQIAAYLQSFI